MRVILFIALRMLWDRKLLNGIAIVGVTLGVVTLIGINGIMQGFQQKFLRNILQVSPHVTMFDKELHPEAPILTRLFGRDIVARVAHESPSDRQLRIKRPDEVVAAIERLDGVAAASGSLNGSGILVHGGKEFPVDLRGIQPTRQEKVTPISQYILQGSFRSFVAATDGILLGSGVASRIGAHADDVLVVAGPRGRLNMKVYGVFEAGIPPLDNSRVYVPIHAAQTLLGRPDTVGRVEVKLVDPEGAVELASRLESLFGYDAESWQEANANFLALFKQQNSIISFVVGAILAVGGFGILAIQIMIVLQKTRDIAILRSYGFQRRDILAIFLLQGGVLALIGALTGDLLGNRLLAFLGSLKIKQEGLVKSDTFLVYDDPKFYVYGVLFALGTGLFASFIPALRGSRVEPVDVLRGQI